MKNIKKSFYLNLVFTIFLISCVTDHSKSEHLNKERMTSSFRERKVLMIGDSLSSNTNYAFEMVDRFSEGNNFCHSNDKITETHFYALPSAAPRHFNSTSGSNRNWLCKQRTIYMNHTGTNLTGRDLCHEAQDQSVWASLIDKHQPTDVIITLGTNSMAFGSSYIRSQVRAMIEEIPENTNCYWVAPTYVSNRYKKQASNAIASIESVLSDNRRCRIIKSFNQMETQNECSSFLSGDGLHHTSCGSQIWGRFIGQKVCEGH